MPLNYTKISLYIEFSDKLLYNNVVNLEETNVYTGFFCENFILSTTLIWRFFLVDFLLEFEYNISGKW